MADVRTGVYTDGACQGNPGAGGWAWAVRDGPYASGAAAHTTNQRMELAAALAAVTALGGPLEVISDSTYVVNCFRDRWWEGWLARGWLNSAKKPVSNRDLWEPLIDAYRADPSRLRFRWVKGHAGDPMNDLVDRLAVEAAATQTPRRGTGVPTGLGPADVPARPRVSRGRPDARPSPSTPSDQAQAEMPVGHLVVVGGLKPPMLGGYEENPTSDRVKAKLIEILVAKRSLHPDLIVVSGLGLGAEQLGAEAALESGIPFVGVLPFPGVERVWAPPSRTKFALLCQAALKVIVLSQTVPADRRSVGAALSQRDSWMARQADEAVIVWDRDDRAVASAVRSMQDHLGEEEVWVVEP
jgi:ribonuclease HI